MQSLADNVDDDSDVELDEQMEDKKEDYGQEEVIKSAEAERVVNLTFFTVGGGLVLMIIGLLIYFFIISLRGAIG